MATMPSDVSMHVILVPFPAQGHFAAFLSLAERLHAALPSSAAITLVSTPRNVAALRAATSSSAAAPFLRFHALPFVPEEHGLPAGAESADAVDASHFLALFHSTESPSLQAAFDAFLAGVCCSCAAGDAADEEEGGAPTVVVPVVPVVVVADPFQAWTVPAARRRGARHAFFDSCGAFGSVVYHSLWNHLPHRRRRRAPGGGDDAEAEAFCLPDHPEVTVHRSQLPAHLLAADGTDPWSAFHRRQTALGYGTDAVLVVNTTEELEPAGLRMLRRTLGGGVPVLPIGPLIRLPTQHAGAGAGDSVMRWLDAREKPLSVLYISFGSQNSLRADQMMELAAALELTGRPFVWAIRPPVGFAADDDALTIGSDRWLPAGFEERVRGGDTGLLVRGWAPQLRILAHASTGAFLSHCGWNSVLESVAHGVPVVGWPLQGDQFFNCQMLEREWGACVEVVRGNKNNDAASVVQRARLAEVLETVMGDTAEAAAMRRRVKEIQGMIGRAQESGGSSAEALKKLFASVLPAPTDAAATASARAGAVLGLGAAVAHVS